MPTGHSSVDVKCCGTSLLLTLSAGERGGGRRGRERRERERGEREGGEWREERKVKEQHEKATYGPDDTRAVNHDHCGCPALHSTW